VATKTSPRRQTGRRSPSSSKRRSTKRTRKVLSPWIRDAVGIGLVVSALLAVLALWFGSAGPAGHAISWILHAAFGLAAVTFPPFAVWWGAVLLRDLEPEDRIRIGIGSCILILGALGLLSLARSDPSPLSGYAGTKHQPGLSEAGGLIGALGAWPLARVLSAIGAALVDLGVLILGLLVITATPISAIGRKLSQWREARDEADPVRVTARLAARGVEQTTERTVLIPEDEPPLAEEAPEEEEPEPPPAPRRAVRTHEGPYQLPPLDLLREAPASAADGRDEEQTMQALERTLTTFGVDARVTHAHRGPTVTMYEVDIAAGTKVNKVTTLSSDIAYALATPDVRIIAPIPGKSAIGVEVPNKIRDFVMLGDVLRSKAARGETHPLSVALGKDVHGRPHMVNLAEMPHLLVAGATGAGKSSLINSFITSILVRTTPDDVRLVLVDPKRVELSHFADVPHLLSPVIVHPKRAAEALGWIVREMELRYELLAMAGVRDIEGYETGLADGSLHLPPGQEERFVHMPFIVLVIDELADLMMVAPRDVEDAICRIAQMARAVGIHLVVATQRPSVDVVTGLIKANIPSRIALMTSSQADSRVVLDMNGAEKLVGHGDMLFAPSTASKPTRLQGAWVTEQEIAGVTRWIRDQREVVYENTVEGLGGVPSDTDVEGGLGSDDDLLQQAAELVIRSQLGSTSMLQRKLKVGFARAGRLMDLLEEKGLVGPSQGSKARDVLVTWDDWQERRSPESQAG
jgi:S-DNA-T family DNA segregation ATPase FtsK/SpoIIIE